MSAYRDRLLPFIRKWTANRQRIAIFGVGSHTDLLFDEVPELAQAEIVAFLDNNPERQGSTYRQRPVHPPAWAKGRADVILCSSFVNEHAMADSVGLLSCTIVLSHTDSRVIPARPDAIYHRRVATASGTRQDLRSTAPRRTPETRPRRADVVILPIIDWGFRFQRPQQLALQLAAEGHRVFYVRNTFHGRRRARVRLLSDRVFEVTLPAPRQVNIYTDALEGGLLRSLSDALEATATDFGLADVLCLVDLPFWWPLASHMKATHGWRIIYDCMDEHAGFPGTSDRMLSSEQALLEGADLVVASSQPLLERVTRSTPRTLLLPNAADFEHFARPVRDAPTWLASLPRPIIGYYGAVAEWLDVQLLETLARARPAWSFVIIGKASGAVVAALTALPNVHMRSEQPYEELPPILHAFDVCTIPFRRTPLTDATNPVKLYEYWSAGKPVVATRLTELERLGPELRQASTAEEWLAALDLAILERSAEAIEKRKSAARLQTWSDRARTLLQAARPLHPMASVVIVTRNGLDVTRLCLASLIEKTRYPSFEIIAVDNGSTDGTPEYLTSLAARYANVRVLLNEHNAGFAAANNQGVAVARGDRLVFLNNDTVVPPEWLSRLSRHLEDPTVGLVGPVTNWSGNESRIDVPYHSLHELDDFSHAHTSPRLGRCFDIPMLAFFCVAIRKALFDQLGPLDEAFGVGMFEDDDYALRVRQAGLRCVCAEDAFVHHWGRASFSHLEPDAYAMLFERNRAYFERKWQRPWIAHRARRAAEGPRPDTVLAELDHAS